MKELPNACSSVIETPPHVAVTVVGLEVDQRDSPAMTQFAVAPITCVCDHVAVPLFEAPKPAPTVSKTIGVTDGRLIRLTG